MGFIHVTNIHFSSSSDPVSSPFTVTIRLDCLRQLDEELEWRFVYVGDPEDSSHDQLLDFVVMDKIEYGPVEFDWEVPPPDYSKIPEENSVFDSSIIQIIALIRKTEFFRCSFLIAHDYESEELKTNPPERVDWTKLHRKIGTERPMMKIQEFPWEKIEKGENGEGLIKGTDQQEIDMLKEN